MNESEGNVVQKRNNYVREFDGFPVFYYNISTKPQNVITEKGDHIGDKEVRLEVIHQL